MDEVVLAADGVVEGVDPRWCHRGSHQAFVAGDAMLLLPLTVREPVPAMVRSSPSTAFAVGASGFSSSSPAAAASESVFFAPSPRSRPPRRRPDDHGRRGGRGNSRHRGPASPALVGAVDDDLAFAQRAVEKTYVPALVIVTTSPLTVARHTATLLDPSGQRDGGGLGRSCSRRRRPWRASRNLPRRVVVTAPLAGHIIAGL